MLVMAGLHDRIIRYSTVFGSSESRISRIPNSPALQTPTGRFIVGRQSAVKPHLCWAAIRGSFAESQCSAGTANEKTCPCVGGIFDVGADTGFGRRAWW